MLSKGENFSVKIFVHYTDIVIFVLVHFNLAYLVWVSLVLTDVLVSISGGFET